MMRTRPPPRLAEAERPIPALRRRTSRRPIVRRASRRAHAIVLRVGVTAALDESGVGSQRERESRQVPREPVDRDLTPAVLTAGEADGRLARKSRDRTRMIVWLRAEGDSGSRISCRIAVIGLSCRWGGRNTDDGDDGKDVSQAR